MIDDGVAKIVVYPTATLVLGWFARALIAKVVKDGSDRAGDRAVVEHIQRQAARIRELEERETKLQAERNDAVSQVGGLKAEIHHLTMQVEALTKQVATLSRRVDENSPGHKSGGGEQWPGPGD